MMSKAHEQHSAPETETLNPGSNTAERSISNEIEKLGELTSWLTNWLEEHTVVPSIAYKLRFAMEEITTNAVYYGFPTGSSGTVNVRVTADAELPVYALEILDDGEPFNPLEEVPDANPELDLDEREIGGLGVFLVKNMFEDCHYQRVDGWNHLTINIAE